VACLRLAGLVRLSAHTTPVGTTFDELDCTDHIVEWVKVPSHVQVSGNEEADKLAEEGRRSSPLYLQQLQF
jgi:ribonuclease HI